MLHFFQDLGKSSNDLLGKDYPFNTTSLEIKTKANDVSFKVAGNNAGGAIVGDLEAKYGNKKHGFTLTNTWTTANVLKSQIELENQLAKGLKVDILSSLAPEKGTKSAVINAAFKQSGLHTRAALDVFKVCSYFSLKIAGTDYS